MTPPVAGLLVFIGLGLVAMVAGMNHTKES